MGPDFNRFLAQFFFSLTETKHLHASLLCHFTIRIRLTAEISKKKMQAGRVTKMPPNGIRSIIT